MPSIRGGGSSQLVPGKTLVIGGVTRFTTTDYPGRLAAVIFAQGCPWRCGYCHNPHLLPSRAAAGRTAIGWREVVDWLRTRVGLLDAVVFSGGEPTAQAALADAVGDVRELGFAVGLHTSGAYPRRLAPLLPALDWVGLDIKAPERDYRTMTGLAGSGEAAFAALDLLRESAVAHEVRTTVHPELTRAAALETLADELAQRGVTRWVLQGFRPLGCADMALNAACPETAALDDALLARLAARIPTVVAR